ncbi:MAG: hypothetical protein DMF62_02380 [Acidobacteria bacterium]|nr:MAG: hypothetical protein DMF62_02380 [Acidobacteriota bacterium]
MESISTTKLDKYAPSEADALAEEANAVVSRITDAAGYCAAAEWIKARKAEIKSIESDAEEIKDAVNLLRNLILDKIRKVVWPRKHGIKIIAERMVAWKQEERILLKNEQDRLMSESVKEADEERLAAAEQLAAQGNLALAEAILENAGHASARIVSEVKVEGINHKKRWRARVMNKRDLIHAIERDPGLMDAVKVDQKWLDDYVHDKITGGGTVSINGVEPYEEETIRGVPTK